MPLGMCGAIKLTNTRLVTPVVAFLINDKVRPWVIAPSDNRTVSGSCNFPSVVSFRRGSANELKAFN